MSEPSPQLPNDPYRPPTDVDSGAPNISLGKKWLWFVPIAVVSGILGVMFYANADSAQQPQVIDLIESIEDFGGDRRVGAPYEEIINE